MKSQFYSAIENPRACRTRPLDAKCAGCRPTPPLIIFEKELNRLVESFGKRLDELKQPGYAEAQLRSDFLDPFFAALGWDMTNSKGLIQREREVEIESATQIGGGHKRADYLFRTDQRDRFVCEAKKPAEELHSRYAFQAKRYAWNKGVWMALLTDFEELKIYIVGGKPHIDEPPVGEWKNCTSGNIHLQLFALFDQRPQVNVHFVNQRSWGVYPIAPCRFPHNTLPSESTTPFPKPKDRR